MNKIDDIKQIRELTDGRFGLAACKDAYERFGCDLWAAAAYLNASQPKEESVTVPKDFESYKTRAESRANRKAKRDMWRSKSSREKEYAFSNTIASIASVGAFLFLIVGTIAIVLVACGKANVGRIFECFGVMIGFVVLFTLTNNRAEQVKNMSNDEYRALLQKEREVRAQREEARKAKAPEKAMRRLMRYLMFWNIVDVLENGYKSLTNRYRK